MKNKFTFFTLLFTSFVSYSQIKTNNSKPHISVVVAPFSDVSYDIEMIVYLITLNMLPIFIF